MPTNLDTSWLEVLLNSPPVDYIRNDTADVLALVRAGYLSPVHCYNDFMLVWDTVYVLTERGAVWTAGEPFARVHSAWRRRLAGALANDSEAA